MDAGKRNEITMETLWRKAEKDGGLDRLRDHGALAAFLRHFSDVNTNPRPEGGTLGHALNLAARRAEIRQVTDETVMALLPDLKDGPSPEPASALPGWEPLFEAVSPEAPAKGRAEQEELASRLKEMERQADRAAMEAADTCFGAVENGLTALVINPWPTRRAMFTCIASRGPLRVFDGDRELQAQFIGGDGATAVELEMDGFSVRSLRLEENGVPCETVPMEEAGFTFDSEGMHLHVLPDGRITEYRSRLHPNVLAAPGGNILEADLLRADGTCDHLTGAARGGSRIERGSLFDNVLIEGLLGNSPYSMVMYLPKCAGQRVEIMTELHPSPELMEALSRPGSELRCLWHCAEKHPDILADGPLGLHPVSPGVPFRSANGCALTRNGWGLMYDHQGITRARFESGTLVTLWAEGGPGSPESLPSGALDARSPSDPSRKIHRFFNAIDLTDTADPGEMFNRILYYQLPMFPFRTGRPVPPVTLFSLKRRDLVFTSLLRREGRVYLRVWNAGEKPALPEAEGLWKLHSVLGEDGAERRESPFVLPGEFAWLVLETR